MGFKLGLKKLEIFGEEGKGGKRVTDSESSRTRGKVTGMYIQRGDHEANLINKMCLCFESMTSKSRNIRNAHFEEGHGCCPL